MTTELPYYELRTDFQVSMAISQGKLPSRPGDLDSWSDQTQKLWYLAESCWKPALDRPSIHELLGELYPVDDAMGDSREYEESRQDDSLYNDSQSPSSKDPCASPGAADLPINEYRPQHQLSRSDNEIWQGRHRSTHSGTLIEQDRQPAEVGDVDSHSHQSDLAIQCFDIMEKGLHFNMCSLDTSFIRNIDVHDLRDRLKTKISQDLENACTSWFQHLVEASASSRLLEALSAFAYERLLFWFEVMSLLGKFRIVVSQALLRTASWAVSTSS